METIEIDGSYGEGGGAILRLAGSLAAVTSRPVRIFNIRSSRPKPGLQAQHLESIKAIAALCNGTLSGAFPGSTEIRLNPGKIEERDISISISTAGSIALLFQSLKLLSISLQKGIKVEVRGGATFGKFAPPLPYTQNILLPTLRKMGFSGAINIKRHGFYPAGGADAIIELNPCKKLQPVFSEPLGKITEIKIHSIASSSLGKAMVAERQAKEAESILKQFYGKTESMIEYADTLCPGSGIVIEARDDRGNILGSDGIGERDLKAEIVGERAARRLKETIEAKPSADDHLSDQLLAFMALAKGESRIFAPNITQHARTNIWVINKFLKSDFEISKKDSCFEIRCSGFMD